MPLLSKRDEEECHLRFAAKPEPLTEIHDVDMIDSAQEHADEQGEHDVKTDLYLNCTTSLKYAILADRSEIQFYLDTGMTVFLYGVGSKFKYLGNLSIVTIIFRNNGSLLIEIAAMLYSQWIS